MFKFLLISVFFISNLSARTDLDEVKFFIKKRICQTWLDHPLDYEKSKDKEKLEIYFEIYDFIKQIQNRPQVLD